MHIKIYYFWDPPRIWQNDHKKLLGRPRPKKWLNQPFFTLKSTTFGTPRRSPWGVKSSPGPSNRALEPQIEPWGLKFERWGLKSSPGLSNRALDLQIEPWSLKSSPGDSYEPWTFKSSLGALNRPLELRKNCPRKVFEPWKLKSSLGASNRALWPQIEPWTLKSSFGA